MRAQIWISLVMCLAAACGSSKGEPVPDAAPSAEFCNGQRQRAAQAMGDIVASVPQCEVDADCKVVSFGVRCVDCYWIVGNEAVRAALTAKAPDIEAICADFHAAGCKVIPSGCNPPPVDGYQCMAGKCIYPSPSRRND